MVGLKFLLDENISRKLFSLFKKMDFDVESVRSLNLLGISNGNLLQIAFQKKRILVTFDKELLDYSKRSHMGILLLDIHPARDPYVLPIVEKFLEKSEIQQLNWESKIIILKKDTYEIIEQK